MIGDFLLGILEFLMDLWSLTWLSDSERQKNEMRRHPDREPRL